MLILISLILTLCFICYLGLAQERYIVMQDLVQSFAAITETKPTQLSGLIMNSFESIIIPLFY